LKALLLVLLLASALSAQPDLQKEENWPEQSVIYHPQRGMPHKPDDLPVRGLWLQSEDGVKLHSWWLAPSKGRPVIVHFHGTFSNLESTNSLLHDLHSLGLGVLAIDYRGYGLSKGRPSETGLYRDARAAYALALRLGARPEHLIIHGHSLGGAVAMQLALEKPCAGLILESTFSSAQAMGLLLNGPAALAIQTRYDNLGKAARLKVPLLLIHGETDPLIPVAMGKLIYLAAPQPKTLWLVPGGNHGGLNGKTYADHVKQWLARLP